MDPPRPPSPPSGPPFGTNFSRRKELAPEPPVPATTCTTARSMNTSSSVPPAEIERAACGVRRGSGSPARPTDRENRHRNDVPSVVAQLYDALAFDKTRINGEVEPIFRLICFFLDNSHFGNEVASRACAARRPVVRADGRARSHELVANDPSRSSVRELINQMHD